MVSQARAAVVITEPLLGTFMGLGLVLRSDRLHDLGGAIPDVMGLRAIQPKAAIVKVMSVPDSRCVRVIVPDGHLANRFHEILIHDMEDEEPPFVGFSELGCLRLDWPKAIFALLHDISFNWIRCARNAGSGLALQSPEFVRHVASTSSRIWVNISPYTTWSWHSCGGDLVYCLEGYIAGLHRSYEEGS